MDPQPVLSWGFQKVSLRMKVSFCFNYESSSVAPAKSPGVVILEICEETSQEKKEIKSRFKSAVTVAHL